MSRRFLRHFIPLVMGAALVLFSRYVVPALPSPLPAALPSPVVHATVPTGNYFVTRVVDGDTIEVKDEAGKISKVRLIGIDTPETVDPRKAVQCFGKEASNRTKYLLMGQTVNLEADPTQDDLDKYGRMLRYVSLSDGTDVNLSLVRDGYAHEYTYRIPYQRQAAYKAAQIEAREAGRGLWAPGACAGK